MNDLKNMFNYYDRILREHNWVKIDNLILETDLNKDIKYLVGILSVTNPWKENLKNRDWLLNIVKKRIEEELGEDRVLKILGGLL